MLETCFLHLPGVGPAFEARLRGMGVLTWEDALSSVRLPCGPARASALRAGLEESRYRLASGDARWFGDALPPAQQWRLFPHFRSSAAYVDIETAGPDCRNGRITTIALYDGERVRTYVRGENLESFAGDIAAYKLLVTWNGRGFDAPILRHDLRIPLDRGGMAHLDLLPVFRAMNLRGGLKKVEKALGVSRGTLDGVDGWAAVLLWNDYQRRGDRRVLETLLAYNVEDVLSLEYLADLAVRRLGHRLPPGWNAAGETRVRNEMNPFSPDPRVLRRLGL